MLKILEETHGRLFELVRHYVASMFDSELFSSRGQGRTVAISAFALAIPAGLVLLDPPYLGIGSRPVSAEALRAAAIAGNLALINLVMVCTGLLAVLQWQSLFPSRRDYLALAGLPVGARQIFAARWIANSIFSAGLVIALNLLPGVLAPHQFTSGAEGAPRPLVWMAAGGLGCLTMFFCVVALEGLLLNLLPGRWFARASGYAQGALIAMLLFAGLFSWFISDWDQAAASRLPAFAWAPQVWFLGLEQRMLGSSDGFVAAMAQRALLGGCAAPALAAILYLLSYGRARRRLLESPYADTGRLRAGSLLGVLSRDPRQQAILHFMAKTIARSPMHRTTLLAYLGAALGLMFNALLLAGFHNWSAHGPWEFAVLYFPLGVSVILMAGIRHVFSMPAELGANWIFRAAESQGRAAWMAAVERFVYAFIILPVFLISAPCALLVLSWATVLRMTAMQWLVAAAAFEFLFYSWQQLPFTCSYVPGKRPLVSQLATWIGVLCALLPIVAITIAAASRFNALFAIYCANFAAYWLWARRRRREGWGEARLIYEDAADAMPDLGIRNIRWVPDRSLTFAAPNEASVRAATVRERGFPRLHALLHRRQLERDLDDELAFHLAMRGKGARRQFGNVTSIREQCRDPWTFVWLETFLQDLRYGARQLRRSPGFTLVAAITLALGIGATTALFSMFDTVLWRPIALPHLESLVVVEQAVPNDINQVASAYPADLEDIRRSSSAIQAMATWHIGFSNLVESSGEPVRVEQARVSDNFFELLGVQPALGRTLRAGASREAVLSDGCWRRRFGADPGVVGRTVRLDGENYTVIGVMPADFAFPRAWKELWLPLELTAAEMGSRSGTRLDSIVRLRPGRTRQMLAAELNTISRRLEKIYPETNYQRRFVAWPVERFWTGVYAGRFAAFLMAGALFVLLIACANVANLQFARAAARAREVAVRTAIGAGRRRIIRQLVTESALVAGVGVAIGLGAARWALALLKAGIPAEMRHYMPQWSSIGLNPRALAFAMGAATLSAMLAALAPALGCSRPNLVEALKEGGQVSAGGRKYRLRAFLVAGEIAAATVLVCGAALMVRSFRAALDTGPALEPAALLTLHVPLAPQRSDELLGRLAALPGVRSVAAGTALPHSRHWSDQAFTIEGRAPERGNQLTAQVQAVTPAYFETLRIPLLAGRRLSARDDERSPRAAVVSRYTAAKWWPGEAAPIGRHIRLAKGGWITIAGVVDDIQTSVPDFGPSPTIYLPYAQFPSAETDVVLRVAGAAAPLAAAVRATVREFDRELPITNLNSMAELIRQESFGYAYMAWLMGIFGLLALGLSAIGVYGMMAHMVAASTHEIGIRVALGARPRGVLRMVFLRGMRIAGAGLGLGLIPALALARLLMAFAGRLAGPPATLLIVPLVLGAAAALAIYVPARRALRIDPIAALKEE
jgi:putative ABC transport system permease protein